MLRGWNGRTILGRRARSCTRSLLRKSLTLLSAIGVTALFSSCPKAIDTTLLHVVQDQIAPTLVITSPKNNDEYRATVKIVGKVQDSSFKAGDDLGTLKSLSFSVQDSSNLDRSVVFTGTQYAVSPTDSSFTYDKSTGHFSIVIKTADLIRDKTFIVTATDANGNESSSQVQLLQSEGMVIIPDSTIPTTYTAGSPISIGGTIENSTTNTTSADQLKTLTWSVQAEDWGTTLDLTPGATYTDPTNPANQIAYLQGGVYTRTTDQKVGLSNPYTFAFDPSTRRFASGFYATSTAPNPIIITITATDYNGISTQQQLTMIKYVKVPDIFLTTPDVFTNPTIYYSSSVQPELTYHALVSLKDGISISDLADFSVSLLAPGTGNTFTYHQSDGAPYGSLVTMTQVDAQDIDIAFPVPTAEPSGSGGMTGSISLTISATYNGTSGPVDAVLQTPITVDTTPPTITVNSFTSNNAVDPQYAKPGNTLTLIFTASDAASGLDQTTSVPTAKIFGHNASSITNIAGGQYKAVYTLAGGDTDNSQVPIQITATDMAGNVATQTTVPPADVVTYYEALPTLSSVTMTSNNSTNAAYANNGDQVQLDFDVANSRVLNGKPSISIAGTTLPSASIVNTAGSHWQATYTLPTLSPQQGSALAFAVGFADRAGNNGTTVTQATGGVTNVTFDNEPPTGFSASFTSSYINNANKSSAAFQFSGAETNTFASYTITGPTGGPVAASNIAVSSSTQTVSSINLSGLGDGTLTLSTTLKDQAGNVGTSSPASVSITKDVVPPTPTSVTLQSPDNSYYAAGSTIYLDVGFSESLTAAPGSPVLHLSDGLQALYYSKPTASSLRFYYIVQAGDNSADLGNLTAASSAITGGTITDLAGNPVNLSGTIPDLAATHAIVVDTTPPAIGSITSTTADGAYRAGTTIPFTVTFSDASPLTITTNALGAPTLSLNTGATATLSDPTGTTSGNTMHFSYTVAGGQNTGDLNVTSFNTTLGLTTVTDAAGNTSTFGLPATTFAQSRAIVIDTTPPTITAVGSTTPNGSYKAGSAIDLYLDFSDNLSSGVSVTGTPRLVLSAGVASTPGYDSGTSTATRLEFPYTVASGDNSSDLDISSISLNGGTIKDDAGNPATLTLPASLAATHAIVVDTSAPGDSIVGTVTAVGGTVKTNIWNSSNTSLNVPVPLNSSDSSLVNGSIQIVAQIYAPDDTTLLASDTLPGTATISSTNVTNGSKTVNVSAANFDTYLTTNDGLAEGDFVAFKAIVTDLAGNSTESSAFSANQININKLRPTVTSITADHTTGSYTVGTVITFDVKFSETVVVDTSTGTPSLTLNTATGAGYTSGTGTTDLMFTYTVTAGDNTGDLDTTAIANNGGSILDTGGNTPNYSSFPSFASLNSVVIDTTAPTATSVAYTIPGGKAKAKAGDVVTVTVTFSEAIDSGTTMQIAMATPAGGTDGPFAMTRTNSTHYSYNYTTPSGDGTSDVSALTGGADIAGNAVNATPTTDPGYTVDNTPPTATIAYNKSLVNGGTSVTVTATFSEAIDSGTTMKITMLRPDLGTDGPFSMSRSNSTTYTYSYSAPSGNGTANVSALTLGTDLAGNVVTATPTSDPGFTVDNTPPTGAVTYGKTYARHNAVVNVEVYFSEALAASPVVKITLSGAINETAAAMTADTMDPTHYTYAYTVSSGTANGAETASFSVGKDLAGNVVTATPTSDPGFIVDNTAPTPAPTIGTTITSNGGPNVTQGYWNSDTTSLNVIVNLPSDNTLNGGSVTVQARVNGGTRSIVATASIAAADITNTYVSVNVPVSGLSAVSGWGTDQSAIAFRAMLTDAAGNNSGYGSDSTTTVTYDVTAPTMNVEQYDSSGAGAGGYGSVDEIKLTFSENVSYTFAASDWSITANGLTGFVGQPSALSAQSATSLTLDMSGSATSNLTGVGTAGIEPTISYSYNSAAGSRGGSNAEAIKDTAGNLLATVTNASLTDKAAPVLVSVAAGDANANYQVFDDTAGGESLTFTFSEPMTSVASVSTTNLNANFEFSGATTEGSNFPGNHFSSPVSGTTLTVTSNTSGYGPGDVPTHPPVMNNGSNGGSKVILVANNSLTDQHANAAHTQASGSATASSPSFSIWSLFGSSTRNRNAGSSVAITAVTPTKSSLAASAAGPVGDYMLASQSTGGTPFGALGPQPLVTRQPQSAGAFASVAKSDNAASASASDSRLTSALPERAPYVRSARPAGPNPGVYPSPAGSISESPIEDPPVTPGGIVVPSPFRADSTNDVTSVATPSSASNASAAAVAQASNGDAGDSGTHHSIQSPFAGSIALAGMLAVLAVLVFVFSRRRRS